MLLLILIVMYVTLTNVSYILCKICKYLHVKETVANSTIICIASLCGAKPLSCSNYNNMVEHEHKDSSVACTSII